MRSFELSDGELLLRRAKMHEARLLARAVQDCQDYLEPFLPWATEDYDLEAARNFLDYVRREEKADRGLHLSIFLADTGALIGGVGLMRKIIPDHAEIGYWIHADHAGRGHATQACVMLMQHGFAQADLRRIYLTCDVENHASRRVAEKLGMRREGRMKKYLACRGVLRDHYLYAVLAEEFLRPQR